MAFKAGIVTGLALLTLSLSAQNSLFEDNKRAVLYLSDKAPVIDGKFDDWIGLSGSSAQTFVFGASEHSGDNLSFFVLRSDNTNLYIYADVADDKPNENQFPAPLAWRNDSVEIYIGLKTGDRGTYEKDDSQIRIVPVSKSDPKHFDLGINDRSVKKNCQGAVVYHAKGYRIEVSIPLRLLQIKSFSVGQTFRCDFQLNDADQTERDTLIHWKSPKDDTYVNPQGWGHGIVQALPEGR